MSIMFGASFLFTRSLKKLIRNPVLIFLSLFQPIVFLLLFTQLFSKFTQVPGLFPVGISYTSYAACGILLQNAFTSALMSGTWIVDDIRGGMLQKMLATQVSRVAILLGRLTGDAFRVTMQTTIILILAYALGFRVATGILGILLIIFIVAFFALAWSGISLATGLKTNSQQIVFGLGAFLSFPLVFISTALVPSEAMPAWMQSVSRYNPISSTVNALRDLSLQGHFSWRAEIFALGYIALIAIVTMGITLYLFRKLVS